MWCKSRLWFSVSDCSLFYSVRSESNKEYLAICPSLVSEECPVHENYKAALLRAKDSDTIVTGRIGGTPVRVLKNRMSREYVRQEKAGADKMELEKYTLGSLRRAVFEGDTATGSLMAGQVAGMLHEVRPVAEILDDLWESGRQRMHSLSELC